MRRTSRRTSSSCNKLRRVQSRIWTIISRVSTSGAGGHRTAGILMMNQSVGHGRWIHRIRTVTADPSSASATIRSATRRNRTRNGSFRKYIVTYTLCNETFCQRNLFDRPRQRETSSYRVRSHLASLLKHNQGSTLSSQLFHDRSLRTHDTSDRSYGYGYRIFDSRK